MKKLSFFLAFLITLVSTLAQVQAQSFDPRGTGGGAVTITGFPASATLTDNMANPTTIGLAAYLMCYDGATWDRCQGGLTDTDDDVVATNQVPNMVLNIPYVYDGSNWVRQRLAIGATGAAPPGRSNFIAGLGSGATGGFLVAPTVCDSYANINIVTATTTLIITGVSGRHVRICGFSAVAGTAQSFAFLSGTGATCGTGTTAMSGGTTAATGYVLGINGVLTSGSGVGVMNQTNATGDSVCIITSAAAQLSGRISYAIY